jgi:histidine triad (HIT) family protein
MDCLFCKIAAGQIPAKTVFSNDKILAFRDIGPRAPTHILVIPKKHIATLNDVKPEDAALVAGLIQVASDVARAEKIDQSGYRLVVNCNGDGGQSVYHLHVHLLGGRQLAWPPG